MQLVLWTKTTHTKVSWALIFGLALGCASNRPLLEPPIGRTYAVEPSVDEPKRPAPAVAPSEAEPKMARRVVFRQCDLPNSAFDAPRFAKGSAVLRPRGTQILDRVANCLLLGTLQEESVVVLGYADPRGSEAHNRALALRRARTVRRYLIHRGVAADRVSIGAVGERHARGRGPESWMLDRRIEIELDSSERTSSL